VAELSAACFTLRSTQQLAAQCTGTGRILKEKGMNKLTIALLSAAALAGCTAEQTSQLQQQASAAIGGAHKVVQDSSAPLGELKQQASAALADTAKLKEQASAALGVAKRVGAAAAILNPELGQQIDEAKQQVDAVKQAADALQGK